MCELPGGVAGDENGVARTRTCVALCAQTRKAAPVADVRTGQTTCFVEKSHLMCALALVLFLLTRAPGRGQCMGLHAGKIPCKHSSAKQHRCRRSLAEKHNFLSLVVRWKVTLSSRFARARPDGLVQFPVTTVHTCRCLGTSNKYTYTPTQIGVLFSLIPPQVEYGVDICLHECRPSPSYTHRLWRMALRCHWVCSMNASIDIHTPPYIQPYRMTLEDS